MVHPHPAFGLWEKEKVIRRKVGRAVPSAPGQSRTAGDSRPYPLRLAKSQAPKGRYAIARGVSPGSAGPKKHKPRRGGTNQQSRQSKTWMDRRWTGWRFTLIRPSATFSLRENAEIYDELQQTVTVPG